MDIRMVIMQLLGHIIKTVSGEGNESAQGMYMVVA
jgi:hypothetical protein